MWGLVNCSQIITHMTLFSLLFPDVLLNLHSLIVEMSQIKIFNLEEAIFNLFRLDAELDEERGGYNQYFEMIGYSSMVLMANIGDAVFFLFVNLLIGLLLLFAHKITLKCKINKFLPAKEQIYAYFFRSLFELTLDIMICGIVSFNSKP